MEGAEKKSPAPSVPAPRTFIHAKTFAQFCLPHMEDLVIKWNWEDHFGIRVRQSLGSRLVVGWYTDEGYEETEKRRPLKMEVAANAKMDEKFVAKLCGRVKAEPPLLVALD